MDRFSPGRFGSDDPWFKVGDVGITTTIGVAALATISMFVWAIEGAFGPIFRNLVLISRGTDVEVGNLNIPVLGVLEGGIWRLLTWPIPNQPDIWTVLLIVIFFFLGSQLEAQMGRKPFAMFLLAMTFIPAVMVTILELVTGVAGAASGLRFLELGVLVAFAVVNPTARFFFGIPAWAIAGVIIVIDTLQFLGARETYGLTLLFSVLIVALFGIRALGHAEEQTWIPKVPLPAKFGGDPYRAANKRREKASRPDVGSGFASGGVPKPKFGRSGPNLQSVPPPADSVEERLADAEIDALLDQVASSGLDSLTPAQRKRLEAHSKRLRKRDK